MVCGGVRTAKERWKTKIAKEEEEEKINTERTEGGRRYTEKRRYRGFLGRCWCGGGWWSCGGGYQRGGAERAEGAEKSKRGEDFNTEYTEHTEKRRGDREKIFRGGVGVGVVGGLAGGVVNAEARRERRKRRRAKGEKTLTRSTRSTQRREKRGFGGK